MRAWTLLKGAGPGEQPVTPRRVDATMQGVSPREEKGRKRVQEGLISSP